MGVKVTNEKCVSGDGAGVTANLEETKTLLPKASEELLEPSNTTLLSILSSLVRLKMLVNVSLGTQKCLNFDKTLRICPFKPATP